MGITSALDLQRPARQVRQALSVVGERIVHELNGQSCLEIEDVQPKQTIMSSRSFGTMISDLKSIEKPWPAIRHGRQSSAISKAVPAGFMFFIRTNRFRTQDPQYSNAAMIGFDEPPAIRPC